MVLCSASKWGESVKNRSGMQDFPKQVLTLREGQARMTLLVLCSHNVQPEVYIQIVTNFIRSYLHQFFEDSHGLKASLKPLRRPFDRFQSRLEAINIGRDIKQINW